MVGRTLNERRSFWRKFLIGSTMFTSIFFNDAIADVQYPLAPSPYRFITSRV